MSIRPSVRPSVTLSVTLCHSVCLSLSLSLSLSLCLSVTLSVSLSVTLSVTLSVCHLRQCRYHRLLQNFAPLRQMQQPQITMATTESHVGMTTAKSHIVMTEPQVGNGSDTETPVSAPQPPGKNKLFSCSNCSIAENFPAAVIVGFQMTMSGVCESYRQDVTCEDWFVWWLCSVG